MNYLRIKKNTEFSKLFKRGKRVFSPDLTLIYFPSQEMRMGIAVSKKHGKAVTRNRVKRLVRETFKKNSPALKKNYAVIVLPKPLGKYSFSAFDKSMSLCIKKING